MSDVQVILTIGGILVTISIFLSTAAVGFAFKISQRVTINENDVKWFKEYVLKESLLEFHKRKNPTPERINDLIDKLIQGAALTKKEIIELAEWLRMIRETHDGREKVKADAALYLLQEQYL